MAIQAGGGNDFVNLSFAPYFITPSATAAANTAALIQAATDQRKTSTIAGKKLYIPGNSSAYPFNVTVLTSPARLIGDGPGSTSLQFPAGSPLTLKAFGWRSSWSGSGSTSITAQMNQGDQTVTVTSTSGWSAGDWVCVGASNSTGNVPGTNSGAYIGEWVRIKSVDSSTQITTWGPVEETLTLAMSPLAAKGVFWQGVALEGFTIDNSQVGTAPATNDDVFGSQLHVCGLDRLRIDHLELINGSGTALGLDTCRDFEVTVHVRDGMDNTGVGEFGYAGLLWNGCQDGHLTVYARRVRHGVTTGGEAMGFPRHITIRGAVRENTGTCWDTHAEGKHLIFDNCHASNTSVNGSSSDAPSAFQVRNPHTMIRGGEAFQCRGWAVQTGSAATDLEIDGLRINTQLDSGGGLGSGNGIDLQGARSIVKNCNIMTPSPSGGGMICVQMEADSQTVMNNVFRRTTGSGGSPVNATAGATNGCVKNNVGRGGWAAATSFISGTTSGIDGGASGDGNLSLT